MNKYKCIVHRIEAEKEGKTTKYGGEGLSWDGTAQCTLFTMKELRAGKFEGCEIKKIG